MLRRILVLSMIVVVFSFFPRLICAGPMNTMPNVQDGMLYADYWINKLTYPEQLIMSQGEINQFNQQVMNKAPNVVYDLKKYPDQLSKEQLNRLLEKYTIPQQTMYVNGQAVSDYYYDNLKASMNREGIQNQNWVQYGFTVNRVNIRTFPTEDAVLEEPNDVEFDMFQETAVEPAQPLLILHTSKDGQWFLVQTVNYIGWMKADCVAVASKQEWLAYQNTDQFLVVTGNELHLGYNEYSPELSELTFGMGVKLPLAAKDEIPSLVDNQSIAGNYVIKVPTRDKKGKLKVKLALVSAANDINEGYLPYTRANIIKQAFKMEGQRYGWGGSFHSRDCSAFIEDIFATFGFVLPRNADEQESAAGINVIMKQNASISERKEALSHLQPGSVLYMEGHTMLFLGEDNHQYYVIHDAAAQGDPDNKLPNGRLKRIPVNQIIVTDVTMYKASGKQLLESIRTMKRFEDNK